eukprot:scaffold343_cov245-Pinguiococcus_pyrenoidosus.AAC.3
MSDRRTLQIIAQGRLFGAGTFDVSTEESGVAGGSRTTGKRICGTWSENSPVIVYDLFRGGLNFGGFRFSDDFPLRTVPQFRRKYSWSGVFASRLRAMVPALGQSLPAKCRCFDLSRRQLVSATAGLHRLPSDAELSWHATLSRHISELKHRRTWVVVTQQASKSRSRVHTTRASAGGASPQHAGTWPPGWGRKPAAARYERR